MKIETSPYTPKEIGEKDIKFRIPLYQRPYAWEAPQVEQLLNDLFEHFSDNRNKDKCYHIGILNIGKAESDSGFYDLIDGQQRITTLYLIGRVFYNQNLCPSDWKGFLSGRLDLYGRDDDKCFLEELKEKQNTNVKLMKAREIIKNFINKKDKREEFSKFVSTKAAFFLAEIPDGYKVIDKILHFVRLNNRGKQLEAYDILKMKMASELKKRDERSDFVKEWNRISQLGCLLDKKEENENDPEEEKSLKSILDSEDEPKEPKESEIFYQSIVTFPEFLLIALARFNYGTKDDPNLEVSHNKDKLLEEFGFGEPEGDKVKIKWDADNVNEFKGLLCGQFKIFDDYFIKQDKVNKYEFKDKEFFKDYEKKLLVFQSYMYVSREPHKWLVEAFNFLSEKSPAPTIKEFLDELKRIDNGEYENIKYEKVDLSYPGINRYWFWRLDYYLWEDREKYFKKKETQKVADQYIFRTNRSIEHVEPQTPKINSAIIIDKEYLHSFGNLAMISQGQNSSLKNESFEMKRAHVESFIKGSKSGTIESLKLLKIYEDFSDRKWDNDNIKKHKEDMMRVLKDSFPDTDMYESIRKSLAAQMNEQTGTKLSSITNADQVKSQVLLPPVDH